MIIILLEHHDEEIIINMSDVVWRGMDWGKVEDLEDILRDHGNMQGGQKIHEETPVHFLRGG